MSHLATRSPLPSTGRPKPRWSVFGGGQPEAMASMAGLPLTRAWVLVGPPLLARVVSRMAVSAVGIQVGPGVQLEVALMSEAPGATLPKKAWALVRPLWPKRL